MLRILLLALGPAFIAASFFLMYQRVEPFATFFYLCAWYGLIFTLDRLIAAREGRSLVRRCGPGFLLVLFWSAVVWLFFELLNLRLANWYYVFVPDHAVLRYTNSLVAFATVFPGIFWIDHYLALRGVGAQRRGRPLRFSPGGLRGLQIAGVVCLALPMAWPRYFFPLVWLSTALMLAPVNYRRSREGLLGQLAEGDYGPLVRMLLAGLIAGFFWEFFNFWARAKWIYTVPFFDELKLFEMPVAGFLGFPPFAVECAIVYRTLVSRRLAPAFGAYTSQQTEIGRPGRAALVVLAAVAGLGVHAYMDEMTVASLTPRVAQIAALDQTTRSELERRGVRYLTALDDRRGSGLWQELESALEPGQLTALRRISQLYLHEGIGLEYGNLLVTAGISSVGALGRLTAEEVHARLTAVAEGARLPSVDRIRVWVRRAPPGESQERQP